MWLGVDFLNLLTGSVDLFVAVADRSKSSIYLRRYVFPGNAPKALYIDCSP